MKKIFYILTAVALLSSCLMEDGFLDKTPLDKLSEDAVFNSPQLAEAYVNGLYTVLSDPFQEGNISCITDEGWFRYGGNSTRYMYDGRLSPSMILYADEGGQAHNTRTTTLNIWNRAYEYIYRMNYFLQFFNKDGKVDEATANRLKGEVLYLRAWAYYNLIQRYAGVPIIKTPHSLNDKDFTVDRANFDDCVEFIRQDIKDAMAILPEKDVCALGRANKDVALALDARVTLLAASPLFNNPQFPNGGVLHGKYSAPDKSTGKWAEALKANKAVVDRAEKEGAYSLDAKYSGYWTNNKSPEIIWAKHFVPNETQNKAQVLYSIVYYNGWTAMEPTQAMIIDYEMTNGKKFFEEGSGYDPKHPFKNRDPRFYYTVAAPFETYINTDDKGTHVNELGLFVQYDKNTYADFAKGVAKEPTHSSKAKDLWSEASSSGLELNKWYDSSKPITESETTTTHYPWFRLGEFFLNYAECAYMVGDENTCREYINKVRARADVNMPAVTETGENLWDRLVNERRIELAFEFTRYFDVRRWRIADFYENVPLAGMRTMILKGGAQPDTVFRMVRTAEQIDKNTCYYWGGSKAQQDWIAANGKDMATIQTYKWLGKEYTLDYGECMLTISPTQKVFVEANYLMPIPETEIAKSLGKIKQNPGYVTGENDWNW